MGTSCRASATLATASSAPSEAPGGRHAVPRAATRRFPYLEEKHRDSTPSVDHSFRRHCRSSACGRHARPRARAGQAQGGGGVHRALRAAMGRPHPQGAQGGRGARRDRIQGHRERQQRRLRACDARVRHRRQPADPRRGLRRGSGGAQGREGLSQGRLPHGLLAQAAGAQLQRVRQLHPGAGLPERHGGRRHDQDQPHRHGRRLSDS